MNFTKNTKPATPLQLPLEGYVRLPQILAVIPVSKSTWWAGVASGLYPQPVRTLGRRITAWRVEDIRTLIVSAGGY
ncbi:MAG: AlpA family phage regulatory protein [Candidatus Nitrotoga sp.]